MIEVLSVRGFFRIGHAMHHEHRDQSERASEPQQKGDEPDMIDESQRRADQRQRYVESCKYNHMAKGSDRMAMFVQFLPGSRVGTRNGKICA